MTFTWIHKYWGGFYLLWQCLNCSLGCSAGLSFCFLHVWNKLNETTLKWNNRFNRETTFSLLKIIEHYISILLIPFAMFVQSLHPHSSPVAGGNTPSSGVTTTYRNNKWRCCGSRSNQREEESKEFWMDSDRKGTFNYSTSTTHQSNNTLGYQPWLPPHAAGDVSLIEYRKDRNRVLIPNWLKHTMMVIIVVCRYIQRHQKTN